jgi:transposase InsO family protein
MVRRCPSCASKQLKRGRKRSAPLTIFPPDRPLEFIAMDILGPLPETTRKNRYFLCIGDRFTKLALAVPLEEQTAYAVALDFMDRWVAYYGIPVTVLTDNGSAFVSKFFRVLTNIIGVKQVFTSAYRPSTSGQVERWNPTLVDALTHMATERDWDLHLETACLSYNSLVHSSTGYAPIELSSTREPSPSVWTRQVTLDPRHSESKIRYCNALLARAARLCAAARETNQ